MEARHHSTYRLEIKQIAEDGSFEGMASTYGNTDLGGDVIEYGAFDKSIAEKKTVPILWSHDPTEPVGQGVLRSIMPRVIDGVQVDKGGLFISGRLELALPAAQKVYTLLKSGIVRGLSIGYELMKSKMDNGVRRISEVKLWEVSVCTFPMNLEAVVTAVKAARQAREQKDDFLATLDEIQTSALLFQMLDALCSSICDSVFSGDLTPDEQVQEIDQSIQEFQASFMTALPKILGVFGNAPMGGPMGYMSRLQKLVEVKAGRRNSAADEDTLRQCIALLQALLANEAAEPAEPGEKGTSIPGAATLSLEPDPLHSELRAALQEELQTIDMLAALRAVKN